jgi:hypothetical protein
MIPQTSQRVPQHTSEDVNEWIADEMMQRVEQLRYGSPQDIDNRLEELEQEWDIERVLEANASTIAFTGCLLAATHDRRWVVLPLVVTAFLFQHALHGWCPPLPVLRRMGFRTQREIDEERFALKALRGDFSHSSSRKMYERNTESLIRSIRK